MFQCEHMKDILAECEVLVHCSVTYHSFEAGFPCYLLPAKCEVSREAFARSKRQEILIGFRCAILESFSRAHVCIYVCGGGSEGMARQTMQIRNFVHKQMTLSVKSDKIYLQFVKPFQMIE